MNWLQFWEWGLWPWLGDVIASQPFLTLMVPVATLTGVVITTKSNERIRRRELQGEGERWRYEVVKDSAAVQRQAVLTFLEGVAELQADIYQRVKGAEAPVTIKFGNPEQEHVIRERGLEEILQVQVDSMWWFFDEVSARLLQLELSISDPAVRSGIFKVRDEVNSDRNKLDSVFGPKGAAVGNSYQSDKGHLFTEIYPMSKALERSLADFKETAIGRLHPLPPEVPTEQPPRNWWTRRN